MYILYKVDLFVFYLFISMKVFLYFLDIVKFVKININVDECEIMMDYLDFLLLY
jgi:hypothetical protein